MTDDTKPDVTGLGLSIGPVTSTSESKVIQTPSFGGRTVIYASDGQVDSLVPSKLKSATENAEKLLETHPIRDQANYAIGILKSIDQAILGYEDVSLPEVDILISEENDIALGWRLDDTILAISIPTDVNSAHWALISGLQDRGIKANGYFRAFEKNLLMAWIVWLLEKLKSRQR